MIFILPIAKARTNAIMFLIHSWSDFLASCAGLWLQKIWSILLKGLNGGANINYMLRLNLSSGDKHSRSLHVFLITFVSSWNRELQTETNKDLPLYRNFEKKILSISQTNTRQSYVKNVLCYNVTPLFGLYCALSFLFSKAVNQLKALGKKKKTKGPVMLWVRNSFDTRPIHPRFLLYTLQKIENVVVIQSCLRPTNDCSIIKTTTEM